MALVNGINDLFVSITQQFTPLIQATVRHVTVPPSLLVSEFEVLKDLNNLSSNKAPGPDGISNQIFKVFAPELAPVIRAIYNQSLQKSFVPGSLKQSIVTPVPKISPPQEIDNDLRPISLINSMEKILEGFTNRRLLLQIGDKIDTKQFARKGHSTTHALAYLLQAIHEAIVTVEITVLGSSFRTSLRVLN